MPDVPRQSRDILRAARDRAAVVAEHLDGLGADLAEPRLAGVADADRAVGLAALAGASAALRDLVAAIDAGGGAGEPGAARSNNDDGGEDVEHA